MMSSLARETTAASSIRGVSCLFRSGGLELLFGQIKTFNVELVLPADASRALTMQDLLTWMRLNLLRERPELFLAEGDNL